MAEALQQREAERQSAEHALKASEMRYRRLFETAQDGILILNAGTGQIDDVNPFLTDMLGYTREQLLGNRLWEIGPFKDTKASKAEFRELQREAYVRYDDLPLETSDGRSINVEFVSNSTRSTAAKSFNATFATLPGASKPRENSGPPAKGFRCFPAGWWRCRRPNAGISRANSTTKSARPSSSPK